MRELLAELLSTLHAGRDAVLCTLVETRGSTPQKAGASMLVLPDGSQRGTLGGGCVEAEVKEQALRIRDPQPRLFTFHLDDNYGWDDGLICGGRMTIVAQLASSQLQHGPDVRCYLAALQKLVHEGKGLTEVILLTERAGAPAGARFLFDEHQQLLSTLHTSSLFEGVASQLLPINTRPKPYHRDGAAFLPRSPKVTLVIVGGGHVGQAVGRLAADADFGVWVLDDRSEFASRERFPRAERLIVADIGRQLAELTPTLGPAHYAIIVTRGHSHDEEALYHLATTRAGYVGLIGSKRKIKLIFDDLRAKGIPQEALSRVHAPLGLDIGSQTVSEIAVSIVAELIAHRNLGATRVQLRRDGQLNPVTP
jgi:xanthine dehydrogenase accessory factor